MEFKNALRPLTALLLAVLMGCGPNNQQGSRKIDPQAAPHVVVGAMAALSGAKKGFFITKGQPTYHDWNAGAGNIAIPLQGADADSFQVFKSPKNASALFARDSSRVYMARHYTPQVIEGADPTSFELITSDGTYSRDSNHVYFLGISIDGVDPLSFEALVFPFSKDKNQAYYAAAPLAGVDRESWRPLRKGWIEEPWRREGKKPPYPVPKSEVGGGGWSRDKNAFYYGRSVIAGVDVGTFEVLSDHYVKDKDHVFRHVYDSKMSVIKGADPATFVVHKDADNMIAWGADAHDANSQYRKGEILEPK